MMHGVRKYNGTARSRMANFEELFATGFFGLRLPYYSTFGFISHMLYLHKVFIKIKNILYIIVAYVRVICMKNEQLIIIFLLANYYNAGCDKMQNHPIYIPHHSKPHKTRTQHRKLLPPRAARACTSTLETHCNNPRRRMFRTLPRLMGEPRTPTPRAERKKNETKQHAV